MSPSNAIHREEAMEGNGGSGGNTTRHLFFWHHQGDHRWSRDARGEHSSKRRQGPTTRASLIEEDPTTTWEREGESNQGEPRATAGAGIYPSSTVAPSRGSTASTTSPPLAPEN